MDSKLQQAKEACPSCGAAIRVQGWFCGACGMPLDANCGEQHFDRARNGSASKLDFSCLKGNISRSGL